MFLHPWIYIYIKKRERCSTQSVEGKINVTSLYGPSSNSLTNVTFGHKRSSKELCSLLFFLIALFTSVSDYLPTKHFSTLLKLFLKILYWYIYRLFPIRIVL